VLASVVQSDAVNCNRGQTVTEPLRPCIHGSTRRGRRGWRRCLIHRIAEQSIVNKVTGRSGLSFRLCTVSENSTASQLVKNGTPKTMGRLHLAHQQGGFWPMDSSNTWGRYYPWPFTPDALASASTTWSKKSLGFNSIFQTFVLHDG